MKREDNCAERGDTANIRENTTNEGYFRGRRSNDARQADVFLPMVTALGRHEKSEELET